MTAEVKMDTLTKLSKARTQLLLNRKYVFWATIGMYQKLSEVPDDSPLWRGQTPTMATDGRNLYFSRSFVDSLTTQELMFVLAHEAGHCALSHHLRRQERDPLRWNVAADYALNQMLMDYRCDLKPPKGALLDDKWKGMMSEEIYAKLKVLTLPEGWDIGQVMDAMGGEEEMKKWDIIVRQAAQQAKAQGYLPGAFEHLLEPIVPKLDVSSMIRHMFSMVVEDDYTWAKPNRRHVWKDMYLPSQRTEATGDVLVGVDVSGSVDNEMAAKFIGVVNVVLTDLHPRKVYFLQCDAAIQKVEEFQKGDLLPTKVSVKGRGGTDMRPIWEWAQDKNLSCAVICSDFLMDEGSFGPKQEFPTLWVTCSRELKAPWGQTATLEEIK